MKVIDFVKRFNTLVILAAEIVDSKIDLSLHENWLSYKKSIYITCGTKQVLEFRSKVRDMLIMKNSVANSADQFTNIIDLETGHSIQVQVYFYASGIGITLCAVLEEMCIPHWEKRISINADGTLVQNESGMLAHRSQIIDEDLSKEASDIVVRSLLSQYGTFKKDGWQSCTYSLGFDRDTLEEIQEYGLIPFKDGKVQTDELKPEVQGLVVLSPNKLSTK